MDDACQRNQLGEAQGKPSSGALSDGKCISFYSCIKIMKIVAAANGKWQMALHTQRRSLSGPRRAHLCTYMYVCAKGCVCVCIRVNKDVVLNANNICTASAKSKKTNEKKGDEAELNTKWTNAKCGFVSEKEYQWSGFKVRGGKWVVGAGGEHVSLAVNGSHVAFLSFRK